jgi:ribose transport system permease protein
MPTLKTSETLPEDTKPARLPENGRLLAIVRPYVALLGVLVVLTLGFGLMSDHFFSSRTFISIANQVPALTVVSVGMTFVLISGGIDLSVGSVLVLSSVVLSTQLTAKDGSVLIAMLLALGVGGLCGVFNGSLSVMLGIPSFVVTLGMMQFARGAAAQITNSKSIYVGSTLEWIGSTSAWGISPAFMIAVGTVILGELLLQRTVLGRYWFAIGANETAARYSGIDSRPYRIAAFVMMGLLCGLGAIMFTSRLSLADPNEAVGLELAAIAAAVIGGTSLLGGRGSVIQTFLGVLVIALLQTGLATLGTPEPLKRMITGGVLVLAVVIDVFKNRR